MSNICLTLVVLGVIVVLYATYKVIVYLRWVIIRGGK